MHQAIVIRLMGYCTVFTARRYTSAVLGVVVLSVRLSVHVSVCLSVTRVLCG